MLLQLFIVFTFSFNFNLAIIEINAPIVITTWAFTNATSKAWDVLKVGGKALDAVEQGASVCEEMQCDGTVGYGGSPDENGETTLDALIMDGKTMNVGAVGALRRVKNAISVARRVLDHTQHSILVGDQATQFAVQMGFREESLSTPESKDLWTEWHKDKHCQPNFWIDVEPDPKEHCGPYHDLNAKTTTAKPKTDKPEDEKCHDEKAHDEKAHAEKAHAEKPHTEKCHTEKPHAEKPHAEKPHDEKPHTEKCHTEKPHAEKPHAEKPHAEKPHDEKPHTEKPHTEKPHAEKPHAEKCHTEKPHAEKAHAEKCHTEKPHAEKPHTDKVHAEKAHTEKIKTEKSKPPEVHMMVDRYNHDTIGMVAIDGYGDLAAATSTNGAKFKIPGRLGDSPIPGAGAYVDNEVGGAAATGDGDVMLRFLPSFTAVDEMRRGAMPDDAARTAIKKIAAYYPNFMGAVIALTKTGLHGAACHGLQKFPYVVQDDSKGTCEVIEVTCEIKCC